MNPKYRIYHGKYPDACTNEIPNAHIRNASFPSFRIEPGKPGEPKIDTYSFTLENLNQDGTERYSTAWFDSNSRTEAEGATIPFQIFFRIVVADTSIDYVGVMKGKKPGRWNEVVEVTVQHIITMALEGNKRMLKEYTFHDCKCGLINDSAYLVPPTGIDLEDNSIKIHSIPVIVEETAWINEDVGGASFSNNLSEYIDHIGFNIDSLMNTVDEPSTGDANGEAEQQYYTRLSFVNIGDNTILTRYVDRLVCSRRVDPDDDEKYQTRLYFQVIIFEANNDSFDEGDFTILPRGRFIKNDDEFYQSYDSISFTVYDFGINDTDLIAQLNDVFTLPADSNICNGCFFSIIDDDPDYFELNNSQLNRDCVDIIDLSCDLISKNVLNDLYSVNLVTSDLFQLTSIGIGRYVFISDLIQYGWGNNSVGEILADLAMQTNSYLFVNEAGKIVFQDRLLHDATLPTTLPEGSFELKISDIKPLGSIDDTRGFESYEISYKDRIEINNKELSTSYRKFVNEDGEVSQASLRNSKITIGNYRTSDLGIPGNNDHPDMPVFRYSPDHASFPLSLDLDDFIPDPVTQAQRFAASFKYPLRIWDVEISMATYTQVGLGKYCWVDENGTNNVYLIKEVHPNPDRMIWGLKLQFVGVYTS